MPGRSWIAVLLLVSVPALAEEAEPKGRLHHFQLQAGVGDVRFSPDGKTLAVAGFDKLVYLYDVKMGQLRETLEGHTGRVTCVAWSPDGARLVTGSDDGSFRIWDPATAESVASRHGVHSRGMRGTGTTSVGFFPDGKSIYSTGYDPIVRIWETETLKEIRRLQGHRDCVVASLSPDGKILATASQDRTARFWDPATGNQLGMLALEPAMGYAPSPHLGYPCFTPDGLRFFAGGGDGRVRSWNAVTREPELAWKAHGGFVGCVDVSSDGGLVATGGMHPLGAINAPDASWDNAIRLWDSRTGDLLLELRGHKLTTCRARFSPDATRLVTASWDGTVQVWDLVALELWHGAALEEDAESLWKRLGEPAGPRAWAAMRAIEAKPEKAIEILGARLQPAQADPDFSKKVADLIVELDHDESRIREKAQRALTRLRPRVDAALQKTLEDPPSAEVKLRIREILETKYAWAPVGEEELRWVRAVRVLESLDGEQAVALLAKLASGDPESALTTFAAEAHKRRTPAK